jgi:1-acyl-sn-glycerol-3-phosphate acyltransferase
MIPAGKSAPFEMIFRKYNEWYLIRRNFHSLTMTGSLDALPPQQPVIYIMNHSSWWDGLLAYHAYNRASVGDHYMMMEERQLKRYDFFRKLGAFSIEKDSPGEVRQSMRYAAGLLTQGKRIWLFPQGEIRHLETRPLTFRPGIGLLLRQSPPETAVIPVSLHYGLYQQPRLQASLHIGEPIFHHWKKIGSNDCAEMLEHMLTTQLDQQRQQLILSKEGYVPDEVHLIRPKRTTDEKFDQYRKIRNR